MTVDGLLLAHSDLVPGRPVVGIALQLSDAELVTLAVLQALQGFTSEARWIRHARAHLRGLFPYVPDRPGYNKRPRHSAGMLAGVAGHGYCASHSRFIWGCACTWSPPPPGSPSRSR